MCPACMTTAALLAAGATSVAGALGLVAAKFRRRGRDPHIASPCKSSETNRASEVPGPRRVSGSRARRNTSRIRPTEPVAVFEYAGTFAPKGAMRRLLVRHHDQYDKR